MHEKVKALANFLRGFSVERLKASRRPPNEHGTNTVLAVGCAGVVRKTICLNGDLISEVHMGTGYYEKLEPGDIVGGLEIIDYSHTDSGNNRWFNILCYCGEKFKASTWRVKCGKTKSCGCLVKATYALRNVSVPYKERCKRAKKGWATRRNKK